MDFQFFIDTLKRRKWLLIGGMLAAGIATFVIMSMLPEQYRANAQIKTGIVDYRGKILERSDKFVQKWQVDNAFSNMITNMQGRDQLEGLTEVMLRHDLTSDTPFRTPDPKELKDVPAGALDDVRSVLVSRVDSTSMSSRGPVVSTNGVRMSHVAEAYEYDFDSIRELLEVKRLGDTDYLDISFVTESPELSLFMVTEFITMFLDETRVAQSSEERKDLEFYSERVGAQKRKIDSLQNQIDRYKRGNAVVDLEEQQRAVVGQLRDVESEIEERRKEIRGYENALTEVRSERTTAGRSKADRNAKIAIANSRVDRVKRELSALNDQLETTDSEPTIRRLIEDKKLERDTYIEQVASLKRLGESKVEDRIIDLEQQELDAKIAIESARKAVSSMEREAERLRGRKSGLVNDEAFLSQLETELGLLRSEYLSSVTQRDEREVIFKKSELPLVVVEEPEFPDEHESRHRGLVSAFSAVTTGTLMALGLFILALLDNKLRNPDQFRTLYNREALASLPRINTKTYSLSRLFGQEKLPAAPLRWIEGVRALRYTIEQSGKKVIQVTSLSEGAGKSTVVAGLAKAFARSNKRVLLLDLNFKHNTLSAYANVPGHGHPFELDYDDERLPKATGWYELEGMDIVGNMGGYRSLAEVLSSTDFEQKLDLLKSEYDVVLMEGAALNLYADSRELAEYADGMVCVLNANEKVNAIGRESMQWLESDSARFLGYILNGVDAKMLK